MRPPRVVLLRGNMANPWDLRPWEHLVEDYDVTVLVPANNLFDTTGLRLKQTGVRTVGARLQRAGRLGQLALKAIGERYLDLERALQGADIVHAAELGTWYAAEAAALRRKLGFRLAITVWETLPFLDAYRNLRTRPYRRLVIGEGDVFLPVTERARTALLLEGISPERIRLCPPGVVLERYEAARGPRQHDDAAHLVLSIGRLVWEKGHQDVLRALALLRERGRSDVRVLIVGTGPEERRLKRTIEDLRLRDSARLCGWIPHDELQETYAQASCLVLASLPTWFWEEQFGMVLAEAMAAHVPVVAASSGAIPEVVGSAGSLFAPGDWIGLADALEAGPLSGDRPIRVAPPGDQLERFSAQAAATRLKEIYRDLMSR